MISKFKRFLSKNHSFCPTLMFMFLLFALTYFATPPFLAEADTPASVPLLHSFSKTIDVKVEANVLMLIDTSGSMARVGVRGSDTHTRGDGTNPYFDGTKYHYYYGRDLITTNDDASASEGGMVNFNYHPNLVYIPQADIDRLVSAGVNPATWFRARTESDIPQKDGDSEYKYPNDSRLYILKNVMHRLLHDENIYKNLRIALSGYYQKFHSNLKTSQYYRWLPNSSSSSSYQGIFWEGKASSSSTPASERGAVLHESFESTSDETHLANLRKWFSGNPDVEKVGSAITKSREFRADGFTPLADSIFRTNNQRGDSAFQFFSQTGVITDYCQDNWLIVLTDGADTWDNSAGDSSVEAVKKLYEAQINIGNKKARNIKTFVLGFIDEQQKKNLAAVLKKMAQAGKTGKDAFFAVNMEELFNALREIFFEIQDRASTAGAPLVTPGRTTGDENAYYQATYHPRSGRQWEGDLVKRVKNEDNTITEKWSAAKKLSVRNAGTRNIITAFQGLINPYDFVYTADLRNILGIGDVENTKHFITWLRSGETYREDGKDKNYKLFDIYRSGVVKIGAPAGFTSDSLYRDFMTAHSNRETIIYVQSNAGMVHGFRDSDVEGEPTKLGGDEMFAFIPPNVLAANRLRGLRWNDNPGTGSGYDSTYSYSRHLLDGPLIAEDVLIGSEYRTLLMGLLGLGGAGMYVLDVTNPTEPSLHWAVENAVYEHDDLSLKHAKDSSVLLWKGSSANNPPTFANNPPTFTEYPHTHGSNKIPKEYDYMLLRNTVSTPFIGRVLVRDPQSSTSEWMWVFIMGNGSAGNIKEQSLKGEVYISKMQNAEIIKKFEINDPVVSPVAVLYEGVRGQIKTFFVGDSKGTVHKGDLSSALTSDWNLKAVLTLQSNPGISYSLDATRLKNQLWIFTGTGDVEDYLSRGSNEQHHFAALNIDAHTKFPVNSNSLPKLDPELASPGMPLDGKGWRIDFQSKTSDSEYERMSTPPMIYNGYVFFSTFLPDTDPCSDGGNSRLYGLKADSGVGVLGDKRYLELENTLISGISSSKGELVLGVTRFGTAELAGFAQVGENMLIKDISWLSGGDGDESGLMKPLYWKSR